MFQFKPLIVGGIILILIVASVTNLRAQSSEEVTQNGLLIDEILQTIQSSSASDAFWSLVVRDTTGKVLEEYNSEKLIRPASNLKLLTSAVVLNELEADYRFSTKMYGRGYQSGSSWEGDILIRGVGDPSISGTFYNEDRFHVFDKFYTALDSMGIKKINGNLIGNDAFFDQQPYPKGWSWDDLSFYYGVEISALSFNNNAVDLHVYANKGVGEKPDIEWFPFDTDYVEFVNQQLITPSDMEYDEYYRRGMGTNKIVLRSTLPKNYVETESLSILDASRFFLDTFKKYLRDGDITLTGRQIVDHQSQEWNEDKYTILSDHRSVALPKLLQQVNKESDNFYIEMLLKTAAAEHFESPGSTELGVQLMNDYADSIGLDTVKMEIRDGSGMAAPTLLTVEGLSHILVKMSKHPHFPVYKNSLSISGVDGSLEYRFPNSMIGKVYGKTGYISGVRSMSGYLDASSGEPLIFSIVANNYTSNTSYIDAVQENIIRKIHDNY